MTGNIGSSQTMNFNDALVGDHHPSLQKSLPCIYTNIHTSMISITFYTNVPKINIELLIIDRYSQNEKKIN